MKNFDANDFINQMRQTGTVPIFNDINTTLDVHSIGPSQQQYDLLEQITDCVLDGVITRARYIGLRSLIRSNDEDNLKLVRNILDKICE